MLWGPFYLTYSGFFDVDCNLLSLFDLYFVKRSRNLELLAFCMGALKVIDFKPSEIEASTSSRSKLILSNLYS